jgi:endonuclease G
MKWLVGLLLLIVVLGLIGTFLVPPPAPPTTPGPTSSATTGASRESTGSRNITTNGLEALGLPTCRGRPLQVVHKQHFTIGYDNERREPAWVSYMLGGPIAFHGKEHRPGTFADDAEVTNPAHHTDYTNSGFDRGHLCPAYAEFSRFGPDAMKETFVTSNIIPQVHGLNAGRWEDLETMIAGREHEGDGWAARFSQVLVMDGPVYGTGAGTITGGEPVPMSCFMIIERQEGSGWMALAVEMPNRASTALLASFLVSIRQIEQDTGLDFNPSLPPAEQDRLEQSPAGALW